MCLLAKLHEKNSEAVDFSGLKVYPDCRSNENLWLVHDAATNVSTATSSLERHNFSFERQFGKNLRKKSVGKKLTIKSNGARVGAFSRFSN